MFGFRSGRAPLFCLAGFLLLAPPRAGAINGTPNWSFSLVVPDPGPDRFITSPDLQFDHYGIAGVAFTNASSTGAETNQVSHAEYSPLGLWSTRTLATGPGFGMTTALSYDRAERPHVAWINSDGSRAASFNFQAPQSLSAAPGAAFSPPTLSLRHDLAGTLRGLYAANVPGQLGAIAWNGTSYTTSTAAMIGPVTSLAALSMVTDGQGRRQVIAAARSAPDNTPTVFLVSEPANSSDWVSGVAAVGDQIGGVDIDVNPLNGRIAWAYSIRTGATSQLIYTESNAGLLTTTTVLTTTSYEIGDISLAFDRTDGQPAIAFEDSSASRLLFAYRVPAGSWTSTIVDASISTAAPDGRPRGPSLAFNDFGTGWPAIAYVDADRSLRVAFDPPVVPEPTTLGLLAAALVVCRWNRTRVSPG